MRKIWLHLIGLCLAGTTVRAQTCIRDVTILDVVHQKLLTHQTVCINGGIISSVQSASKAKIPEGATLIDGQGKFLMPGMTDAHVHFFQSGGLYTRPDAIDLRKYRPYSNEITWTHQHMEEFLRRYVQCGITSVIDVGNTYSFLQQRDSFQSKAYAPHIFMTGPLLTSYEPAVLKGLGNDEPFILVKNAEEARSGLNEELKYHPDFIKIWYIVNESSKDSLQASARRFQPVVKAIIEEAHRNHLKVAVHATQQTAARLAVESGCDYLVHGIEDEVVDADFIRLLKEKHVIDCPTLIVEDGYAKTFAQTIEPSYYELTHSNAFQTASLQDLQHLPDTLLISRYRQYMRSKKAADALHLHDSIRNVNLKKMIDGGVMIAAGTDAGNIGTSHAASYLAELLAMKDCGLTNWQVIQSATINPAYVLDQQDRSGSIQAGKQADLVLLDANPLEDLQNLKKIALVINKGQALQPVSIVANSPEGLIQLQVAAYNARNIDAFMEPYADDIEFYEFPDSLIGKGKEQMRKEYEAMFKRYPNLHVEIQNRIVQGNMVIDQERVTGVGAQPLTAIAIYEMRDGKISKVHFAF